MSKDDTISALRDEIRKRDAIIKKVYMSIMHIADELQDEGDRVYLGSSNHADILKDLRDEWFNKATTGEQVLDQTQEIFALRSRLSNSIAREKHQRTNKDQAYEERNRLVAFLGSLYPSGLAKTDIDGWNPEWHNAIYIDFPWGQASWHYHDSQRHLFEHFPPYAGKWDGHTTEMKYDAIMHATRANISATHKDVLFCEVVSSEISRLRDKESQ